MIKTVAAHLAERNRRFTILIGEERESDRHGRELLLDAAFGPARDEKTCQRLRDGRLPADHLALVAYESSQLIGSLRLWNISMGDRPALLLGPLAVAASHRCCGIGARLVNEALTRARANGHHAIILVGDADYYERFGFDRGLTQHLELPGPVERDRLLGLELAAGALAGVGGLVSATGRRQSRSSQLQLQRERRAA